MRVFITTLLLIIPFHYTIAQITDIPDENFETALIDLGLDDVFDNQVLTENIDTVTVLDISSRLISDLTGIADFISLTDLNCSDNDLVSIDLSTLSLLERLQINQNNLTSLNLSENLMLTNLFCSMNNINLLDLSANELLEQLFCTQNNLSSLDLSGLNLLVDLYCSENNIGILDLNDQENLQSLFCGDNPISVLDLSTNTALVSLSCGNTDVTALNLSTNESLELLLASDLAITSLDLSSNLQLEWLYMFNNNLTELDLRENVALTELGLMNSNELQYILMDNDNNESIISFSVTDAPNLHCIQVDDVAFSEENWTMIDDSDVFSEMCGIVSVSQSNMINVTVYPNPVTDIMTIKCNENQQFNWRLINLNGECVLKGKISEDIKISVDKLQRGVFTLQLFNESQVMTKKIVIN